MPLSTAYAETSTPSPTTGPSVTQSATTGSADSEAPSGQTAVASAPTGTRSPTPTQSSTASPTGTPTVRDNDAATPAPTSTSSARPTRTVKPAQTPTPDATSSASATRSPTVGPRVGATEQRSNAKAVGPAALDPSVVAITKTASAPEANAGDSFSYQLTPSCSGLTTGCAGMTVTDTIPTDLVVDEAALLAQSNPPAYTITYDEATRTVTIVYAQTLSDPPGTTGWPAGSTAPEITIPVTVPDDTVIPDGTRLANTATNVAENAPADSSTAEVVVLVPRTLRPIASKQWADGSAVAGSGESSTITLNVKNESSPTSEVNQLTLSDTSVATFENFDFTGATVTRFPDGADTATLTVTLDDDSTVAATAVAPAPANFVLPPGTDLSLVVGFEVSFSNSDGDPLPYDATGGTVEVGMQLRDTVRSTGDPLRPLDRVTVSNCVTASAADPVAGTVTSDEACAGYDILPDTLVLGSTKNFFPDTNGNWQQDAGEYAVLGTDSPVTATVEVTNRSPFPVREIVINEPDPDSATELDKVDIEQVRLRFPDGAIQAVLTVSCQDDTSDTQTYPPPDPTTVDVASICPAGVTSVSVTYTGTDTDGNPTISPDATAGLDLHGPLNNLADADDLPGGASPGITNCAAYSGDAGRNDGSGTASGAACRDLPIEVPSYAGDGTKTVGQTDVPPGQPIPFHIEWTNNGNVGIFYPVISDPTVGTFGRPVTDGNPFTYLQITSATASVNPDLPLQLQVYDPVEMQWVEYDGVDPAVLARATGVRARVLALAPPLTRVTIDIATERRPDAPDDITFNNCVSIGIIVLPNVGNGFCSDPLQTRPAQAGASLNKSISPSELPRHVTGAPQQYATVDLTIVNTGNLSAQQLQVTDQDADFFDAVDFVDFAAVTFPKGANRVQVDAFVNGAWVEGQPATAAALPAGVPAADVTGIRATFSSTSLLNDGYVITPCATPATCGGQLPFRVSPREFSRSDPATPIPDHLEDTASGTFTTKLDPGPRDIDETTATLDIVDGTPEIAVVKGPDSEIVPGQSTLFNLTVTNTGTNYVHDLRVEDALPPGIGFDPAFVGDNGQPFKIIDTQVPDGTPPVPFPGFVATNDGDRVSRLAWDFSTQADGSPWLFTPGSSLTIQIQVGLEPGVTAGEVLTNTMGATGSDQTLQCQGATDPDDLFGDGTWCTDPATITTISGASFAARKWVSGRAALGWYNTSTTEHVDVGDASCPSTTHDGRTFTAYPCVALVDPGDAFTYLMRLQNAGTEPGRDLRVVDRFPVQGDQGVFVDQERGTQWQNRPTLASEPVLDGPGTLTTAYTDAEPICTDDLSMGELLGPDGCPESAWDDPFGPAAVGIRLDIAFDPFIAPGGTVNVTFTMRTPLDVPRVSDPTIAWNSYAHAEVTDRDGQPNVLPVTEPVKVGVATAYGALALEKVIGENPENLPLGPVAFPFHVVCTIDPLGGTRQTVLDETYQIAADDPAYVIHGIPAGARCVVSETDPQGGGQPEPVTVTITPSFGTETVTTATITNDFPDAVIALTKKVTGDGAAYAPESFPVDLFCAFNGAPVAGFDPLRVVLSPSEPRFGTAVPPGSQCYAVEVNGGGATDVTYDPPNPADPGQSGDVTTDDDAPQAITITNDYSVGGLVVAKAVTGFGTPELAQGPFVFHVSCTFDGTANAFEQDVTVPAGDGTQTSFTSPVVDGIPAGPADDPTTCVVSEVDNGGADRTPAPVEVTIVPGETVTAAFTTVDERANAFSAGTIGLTKVVEGDLADAAWVTDATFRVQVTCQIDLTDATGQSVRATVFSAPVDVKARQTIDAITGPDGQPVKLPVGTHCFGDETATGGATTAKVDHTSFGDGVVVVAQDDPDQPQALVLTATNVFDATSVAVTKKVDGPGAGDVGDTEFSIAISCVLDQGGTTPTPILTGEAHTLTAGDTVTVDDLPVGARCWAVETDDGGADSSTVTNGSQSTAVELVAASTAQITVTNTFSVTPPPVDHGGSTLPTTGAAFLPYLVGGLLATLVGVALLLLSRRRRQQLI